MRESEEPTKSILCKAKNQACSPSKLSCCMREFLYQTSSLQSINWLLGLSSLRHYHATPNLRHPERCCLHKCWCNNNDLLAHLQCSYAASALLHRRSFHPSWCTQMSHVWILSPCDQRVRNQPTLITAIVNGVHQNLLIYA